MAMWGTNTYILNKFLEHGRIDLLILVDVVLSIERLIINVLVVTCFRLLLLPISTTNCSLAGFDSLEPL